MPPPPYPASLYTTQPKDTPSALQTLYGKKTAEKTSPLYPGSLYGEVQSATYLARLYGVKTRDGAGMWRKARLANTTVAKFKDATKLGVYNEEWVHEEGAAATIQRLFRHHKARTEQADERMWEAFKSVDEAHEWSTVNRMKKMQQLQNALCDIAGVSVSMERGLPAPKAFPCPTAASIKQMIEGFRKGDTLPMTDAISIVEAAMVLFSSEGTVMHICSERDTTIVVGDLHGSIPDLFHILDTYGLPGPETQLKYIFNGDLVDRGENSCEVLLVVLCLKLFVPESVFVNRGNHEDSEVNVFYGFVDECKQKYDFSFYRLCADLFDYLPLMTCLNREVLVLHGGLSSEEDVSLSEIAAFTRGPSFLTYRSDRQLQIIADTLWSDPNKYETATGTVINPRGKGCLFAYDVTESFLKQNGLKLLVRSHEEQKTGYRIHHKGLLVTIFSVSNYVGHGNGAAVLVFDADSSKPRVHKWNMSPDAKKKKSSNPKRMDSMSQYIEESIVEHSVPLLAYFENIDKRGTGFITVADWEQGMEDELRLPQLPPVVRTTLLAGVTRTHSMHVEVNYKKFISVHKVLHSKKVTAYGSKMKWHDEAVYELAASLGNEVDKFDAAFKQFDTSHTGSLSFQEFEVAVRKVCSLDMLSDYQVTTLAAVFDANGDGKIDHDEFVGRLSEVKQAKNEMQHIEWSTDRRQERLKELQQKLEKHGRPAVEAALKKHDINGDGRMNADELCHVLLEEFDIHYQNHLFKDLFGILGGDENSADDALKRTTKKSFPVTGVSIKRHTSNRRSMYLGYFGAFTEFEVTVECQGVEPWKVLHRYSNFVSLRDELGSNAPRNFPSSTFPLTSESARVARRRSLEHWLKEAVHLASKHRKMRNMLRVFLRVPFGDHDKYVCDRTTNGTISNANLLAGLCPQGRQATDVFAPVANVLISLLYKYRVELKHIFHVQDEDGTGQMDVEDFRATLVSLNDLEGHPLTRAQLDRTVQKMDKNRDGVIDYKELEAAVKNM